jgi:CubicO group peptidase (beta-lactamase class C family)
MSCKYFAFLALFLYFPDNVIAKDFSQRLQRVDQEFFEQSFNLCNLDYLAQHISPDLVFYHDQSGIQDARLFMSNTEKNICSGDGPKPIRRLFPGSLKSFPLHQDGHLYGAIQHGRHAFYLKYGDGSEELTSTADFTNTWTLKSGKWVLSNVLSYNHQSPDKDTQRIQQVLASAGVPALAIGQIEGGKVAGVDVYGKVNQDTPAPINTLFKVASLTKPIVTMVTLKLVHAGRLSLDESLAQYWVDPDIRNDDYLNLLTVHHVLTHQTGFINWRWMSDDKSLKFTYRPGDGYGYSGEGFEYLRKALERKFDKTIEELAEELVFTPAGMTDSHFWWDKGVEIGRYAINHDESGNPYQLQKYYEANAAANLITTITDYSKFIVFVLNQKNLMPVLYEHMISENVVLGKDHYFGMGWEVFDNFSDGDKAVLHTGKDPGVNTLAVFFPESEHGYVIFMNGDNSVPVLSEILPDLYLGNELWNRR